jgi:hypothetical protein
MDITGAHQLLGYASVAVTLVLLVVASWSALAARTSSGVRDHRFAVDRAILGLLAVVAIAGLVGLGLLVGGGRPADLLHVIYGVAALVTAPVGYWLARRRAGQTSGHVRRDMWVVVAAVVLLGLELRLFMTG